MHQTNLNEIKIAHVAILYLPCVSSGEISLFFSLFTVSSKKWKCVFLKLCMW